MGCGTVVEENAIVNEVTFGETSTGAAMVQGAYVGQGASAYGLHVISNAETNSHIAHARMGGPFGNRGSNESREQTIANGERRPNLNSGPHLTRCSPAEDH